MKPSPILQSMMAVCLSAPALCTAATPVFSLVAGPGNPPMLKDRGSWGGVLEWVVEEGPKPSFVESAPGGYLHFPEESRASIKLKDAVAWLEAMPEEFTVSAWVNPMPGHSSFMELFSTGADTGPDGGFRLRIRNQQLLVRAGGDSRHSYAQSPPGSLPSGSWTHVAVVVDHENVTLYLNGQQLDAAPWASAPVPPRLLSPSEKTARWIGFTIGNYGAKRVVDSYPFVGDLAGVQIYEQALDSSAVESLAEQRPD